MWKGLLAVFVAVPVAAVMIASAFIGQAIAENWDKATTASLVAGLVATCGGGFVVIALLVSLIVGVPLATRFFFEAGVARRAFDTSGPVVTYPRQLPPPAGARWQEETPPQLPDRQSGSWQSSGPGAYRLWEEEPVEVDGKKW